MKFYCEDNGLWCGVIHYHERTARSCRECCNKKLTKIPPYVRAKATKVVRNEHLKNKSSEINKSGKITIPLPEEAKSGFYDSFKKFEALMVKKELEGLKETLAIVIGERNALRMTLAQIMSERKND